MYLPEDWKTVKLKDLKIHLKIVQQPFKTKK